MGHLAQECHKAKVSYGGWMPNPRDGVGYEEGDSESQDPIEALQARVLALSPEDKGRLLQSYGVPTEETQESGF